MQPHHFRLTSRHFSWVPGFGEVVCTAKKSPRHIVSFGSLFEASKSNKDMTSNPSQAFMADCTSFRIAGPFAEKKYWTNGAHLDTGRSHFRHTVSQHIRREVCGSYIGFERASQFGCLDVPIPGLPVTIAPLCGKDSHCFSRCSRVTVYSSRRTISFT